jgi:release factor glutamine methyltransferase
MPGPRNLKELVDLGERVLADSTHIFEDHDNRREAEELLAHTLRIKRAELDGYERANPRAAERYLSLIARRAAGEPFPFLTGTIQFYGLELKVRPGAFVPRASSELTVDRAARRLRRRRKPIVVDLCTGAGPIALALADEFPDSEVWGTDISDEGIRQGRSNARRLGIRNVRLRRGDMYGVLPRRLSGRIDVITAHVPYVPFDEFEDLPAEVREHEPMYTLTDESSDGLDLMRYAIENAPGWLRPGGWLLLEMSDDFATKARRLCRRAGLEDMGAASDEDDLSIVVEARRPR